MTGLELLEKYPRAASVIKNWLLWKMVDALQNESIDEEFKQYMRDQGIDNDKISPMIDANPRMLFDIFDEHDVVIETSLYPNREFTIKIGNQATTNSWKIRKEAELFAIEAAFEILENKLTPKEETDETDNK
jgi:hypothetical protein